MIIRVILEGRESPNPDFWSGDTTLFEAAKCKIWPSQHCIFFRGLCRGPNRPDTMNLFNLKFSASVPAFQTYTFCVVKLLIFLDKTFQSKP